MTDEQIKVLEAMLGTWSMLNAAQKDALTAALEELKLYGEMMDAATSIDFTRAPDTYIIRLGKTPYEYGVCVNGENGRGDYSSILDAFKALKEQMK